MSTFLFVSDCAGHNILGPGQCGGYWGWEEEAMPILGLFKYSQLNLGASLTGSCGVRTVRLGVSMRFMGPEEGRVVGSLKDIWSRPCRCIYCWGFSV
jgi:hypothetical protein